MTPTEARNLLPGTPVMYDNDPEDKGVVLEVLHNGFSVRWEDGMVGVVLFRDAQWINLWQPEKVKTGLEYRPVTPTPA